MAPSAVSFTAFPKPFKFTVRNAQVVYEPGIYRGDGSEQRVNLTLSQINDEVLHEIRELEGAESLIKENGLRSKLDKTTVRIYDEAGNTIDGPLTWRNREVNAILVATGTWKTHSGEGVCLNCTDLQFLPEIEPSCPF